MSYGDWIALGMFGLTGFGMFFGLLTVIWKWARNLDNRFTDIHSELRRIRDAIGMRERGDGDDRGGSVTRPFRRFRV